MLEPSSYVFLQFFKESVVDKKKPSIYSFVEAGNEYFPKLCRALMALVYYTPVHHDDQKHLSNIVEGKSPSKTWFSSVCQLRERE